METLGTSAAQRTGFRWLQWEYKEHTLTNSYSNRLGEEVGEYGPPMAVFLAPFNHSTCWWPWIVVRLQLVDPPPRPEEKSFSGSLLTDLMPAVNPPKVT